MLSLMPIRVKYICIINGRYLSQQIHVAQRITRSATNREIAGSNPVMDKGSFFNLLIHIYSFQNLVINWPLVFREPMW